MHAAIESLGSRAFVIAEKFWAKALHLQGMYWGDSYFKSPFVRFHSPAHPRFRWRNGIDPGDKFFDEIRQKEVPDVLEIGSRRIVAPLDKSKLGPRATYVGMDIMPGPNVDIVGDAHNLSGLFPEESFDGVVSDAVFEHIAMPWQVAREINRVLRPGGVVSIGTHHAYPNHELPWDFWRYGRDAFSTIFNSESGFEILDDGIGWTATVAPQNRLSQIAPNKEHFLFSKVLARKIGPAKPYPTGWNLNYRQALPATHVYPAGTYQLAEEAANYHGEVEINLAYEESHSTWMRYIREILGAPGDGLVICGPSANVDKLLSELPKTWDWQIITTQGDGDNPEQVEWPQRQYDAVFAWEPLSHVHHPWVTALALASLVKPGGSLFSQELATPSYAEGTPEYWRFTSESLRLVFHPTSGLSHLFSAFSEPWIVYAAEPELHPYVSTKPCYRWAIGHFCKGS